MYGVCSNCNYGDYNHASDCGVGIARDADSEKSDLLTLLDNIHKDPNFKKLKSEVRIKIESTLKSEGYL